MNTSRERMAQRPGSGSSSPGAGADTSLTKIFVGGLAWETQCDSMRRYFEQFGEIAEAVVIMDKHTGRSKGYGFVTFREPEAARLACANPTPVIDGRRTNCNLAVLGAHHRSRPGSPMLQGTRFNPLMSDPCGQALIGGAPSHFGPSFPFTHQQGYPYPSPLHGYPAYLPPEYYASPAIYSPFLAHPQQPSGAVYQHHLPLPPAFQQSLPQNVQQQSAVQQEPQLRGGPFAMPSSPFNHPSFLPIPFIQSPGQVSASPSQGPSAPRLVLHAPPFTPAGHGQDQQSSG